MLNVEMAILMMQHQQFIGVPFASIPSNRRKNKKVLSMQWIWGKCS